MSSCYQPQRSCGQGNIFAPVCHSAHRGWSASVHAGIPSPKQTPWELTPPWSRHSLPPRSRHPPRADTPPEQTPPGPHPPKQTPPGSRHPPGADTPGADQPPPPGSRLRHTVNERPVRILLECILVCDCRYDFENVFGYVPNMGISKAERLRRGDSMMTHAMVLTAVHTDDVRDFAIRVCSHCENTKVTLQTANFQMGSLPIYCDVTLTAKIKERVGFCFHNCAV